MNRNPRNHIGKHILAWCKRHDMSYGYACATKKDRKTIFIKWVPMNAVVKLLLLKTNGQLKVVQD